VHRWDDWFCFPVAIAGIADYSNEWVEEFSIGGCFDFTIVVNIDGESENNYGTYVPP
jgi:hypothetical protein